MYLSIPGLKCIHPVKGALVIKTIALSSLEVLKVTFAAISNREYTPFRDKTVTLTVVITYRLVGARKTYLQCVSNGFMSFLHYPIDMLISRSQKKMFRLIHCDHDVKKVFRRKKCTLQKTYTSVKYCIPCVMSTHSLKRKCRHCDEILITGCTGSCHFDNFQYSQWWKFHQNEDILFSVFKLCGRQCTMWKKIVCQCAVSDLCFQESRFAWLVSLCLSASVSVCICMRTCTHIYMCVYIYYIWWFSGPLEKGIVGA